MVQPDSAYGQKLKHTMKYGEQRRTLWLNTHTKDDYGRHRSAILYGMNVTAYDATSVKIAPGAVATPYGTRFFFEQYESGEKPNFNIVNVVNAVSAQTGESLFGAGDIRDNYPVIVCVYLRFIMSDTRRAEQIDDISEFDVSNFKFEAKLVPQRRAEGKPVMNLSPRDPVLLDRIQQDAQEYEAGATIDTAAPDVGFYDPTIVEAAAMGFGEIPLAYIVIGVNPEDGSYPSGLTDRAVEIVQCKNLFSALGDLIGQDVFFGRHGRRLNNGQVTGSALTQQASAQKFGVASESVDLAAPKYGTGVPVGASISPALPDAGGERLKADQDKLSWLNASWDTYRLPSFLRDGDGVVWALRRLDVVLRQWMNRTGDQSLVGIIQDGAAAGVHVRPMMTLDAILYHFTGGNSALTNLNSIDYADAAPAANANPPNHAVKSGLAAHVPKSLGDADVSTYGDTHMQAISALDLSVWHALGDVFGRDFVRQALRRDTSWRNGAVIDPGLGANLPAIEAALRIADGPTGRLPVAGPNPKFTNRPTVTGPVEDSYFTFDPVYSAVEGLADRAQAGSKNWLRNPNFAFGSPTPSSWALIGTATWNRVLDVASLQKYREDVTCVANGDGLQQTLNIGSTDLSEVMNTVTLMHVAVCMRVAAGTIEFGVRGLDSMGATVFEVARTGITSSTDVANYGCLFRLTTPPPANVTQLRFYLVGDAGAQVRVHGVSVGAGVPLASLYIDHSNYEFMSRDGGPTSSMRGDIMLDGHEIFGGPTGAEQIFTDRPIDGAKPTLTGAAADAYLPDPAGVIEAVGNLIDDNEIPLSANWLQNADFTDRGAGTPVGWSLATGAVLLAMSQTAIGAVTPNTVHAYQTELQIKNNAMYQAVLQNANAAVFGLLLSVKEVSVAAAVVAVSNESAILSLDIWDGLPYVGTLVARQEKTLAIGFSGPVAMTADFSGVTPTATNSVSLSIRPSAGGTTVVTFAGSVSVTSGRPVLSLADGQSNQVLLRSGNKAMLGNLNGGGFRAVAFADPVNNTDLVTKQFMIAAMPVNSFSTGYWGNQTLTADFSKMDAAVDVTCPAGVLNATVSSGIIRAKGDVDLQNVTINMAKSTNGSVTSKNAGASGWAGGRDYPYNAYAPSLRPDTPTFIVDRPIYAPGSAFGVNNGFPYTEAYGLPAAGGVLVILADGDVYLEGAVINVSGTGVIGNPSYNGGGGSVCIISRGTIYLGTGFTANALGGFGISGGGGQQDDFKGAGGGWLQLIAPTIDGVLNADLRGNSSGTTYSGAAGWYHVAADSFVGYLATIDQSFVPGVPGGDALYNAYLPGFITWPVGYGITEFFRDN